MPRILAIQAERIVPGAVRRERGRRDLHTALIAGMSLVKYRNTSNKKERYPCPYGYLLKL